MRGTCVWLGGLVAHPGVFFQDVKASAPVWPSFAIMTFMCWSTGMYLSESLWPSMPWLPAHALVGAVLAAVIAAASLTVIHMVALALGGHGDIRSLSTLWGYTYIPEIVTGLVMALVLRFAVFGRQVNDVASGIGLGWLVGIAILALVVAIWSLVLRLQALRVVYARSALICLLMLILSDAATDIAGWIPQLAVRAVLVPMEPASTGIMDAMDPGQARNIRTILEREMSLIPASGEDAEGRLSMHIPVNARAYPPKRGDAVVFCRDEHTRRDLKRRIDIGIPTRHGIGVGTSELVADVAVARVVGLPGEVIEVRAGRVVANGRTLDEPYVKVPGNLDVSPTVIPEGSVFLLGDNRSLDPGAYGGGIVREEKVLGRVLRTWAEVIVPLSRMLVFG